jgi:hypothetical protein
MISEGGESGIFIEGVERSRVLMSHFLHNNCGAGVRVTAGPNRKAGLFMPENIAILSGASSNSDMSYELLDGGHLLVRDIWYETGFSGNLSRFIRLSGPSVFTFQSSKVALPASANEPAIALENFSGRATFAAFEFVNGGEGNESIKIGVDAASPGSLMVLGSTKNHSGDLLVNNSASASVSLLHSQYTINGTSSMAEQGTKDSAFIVEMMAQARAGVKPPPDPVPPGLTDVRFDGVTSRSCRRCIHLQADPNATPVRNIGPSGKLSFIMNSGVPVFHIPWTGPHRIQIADINGRQVFEEQLEGPCRFSLGKALLPGAIYMITVNGRHHSFSRMIALVK